MNISDEDRIAAHNERCQYLDQRRALALEVVRRAGYEPRVRRDGAGMAVHVETDPYLPYAHNTWWSSPSGGLGKIAVNIETLELFVPGDFHTTHGANSSAHTDGAGRGRGECFVFGFED